MALAAAACVCGARADEACGVGVGEPVEVAAVTARLELTLVDGRLVRLAGVEVPRRDALDGDGVRLARADLETWTVGSRVTLAFLDAAPDRWSRLAARVFLAPDGVAIAPALIEAGHARVDPLSETTSCLSALYEAEGQARTAVRGLWSDAGAVVIENGKADYAARTGDVVVVTGTVANVNAGRARTFINLGRDRRASLTLTVSTRALRTFVAAGQEPKSLVGKPIRVRGVIDTRFGPRMEVHAPGAIEVLGEAVAAGDGWHKPTTP